MDHAQKDRRTPAEHAPRPGAALLLRQANALASEAVHILSMATEDVPELDDVIRLMLAIDDVIARLTGDAGGRTGYAVSEPALEPSDAPVIHDTRKHRRAKKPGAALRELTSTLLGLSLRRQSARFSVHAWPSPTAKPPRSSPKL